MQQTPFLYNGCSLDDTEGKFVSMYRWHLPDPIYWKEDCRITIQQIGWSNDGLYERQDDCSTAVFWCETAPSAPLPEMPNLKARIADLSGD